MAAADSGRRNGGPGRLDVGFDDIKEIVKDNEWFTEDIIVKGDEIIEPAVAGRIVTRSQRRNGTPSNRLI